MLVRDLDDRVLLCQLTYKQDWDLPGGVVEVGESPQLAVSARGRGGARAHHPGRPAAAHRLAAAVERLGRRAVPGLRRRRARRRARRDDRAAGRARSGTPRSARSTRSRERCADFTARRIAAALANLDGGAPAYTESGPLTYLAPSPSWYDSPDTSQEGPAWRRSQAEQAQLKADAIGFVDALVIGLAATSPAYSLAAVIGAITALVGVYAPGVLLASFVPMALIATAFLYLNRVDQDCGTTFSWVTRAMGRGSAGSAAGRSP